MQVVGGCTGPGSGGAVVGDIGNGKACRCHMTGVGSEGGSVAPLVFTAFRTHLPGVGGALRKIIEGVVLIGVDGYLGEIFVGGSFVSQNPRGDSLFANAVLSPAELGAVGGGSCCGQVAWLAAVGQSAADGVGDRCAERAAARENHLVVDIGNGVGAIIIIVGAIIPLKTDLSSIAYIDSTVGRRTRRGQSCNHRTCRNINHVD